MTSKADGFLSAWVDCNNLNYGIFLTRLAQNTATTDEWHMIISSCQDNGTGIQIDIPLIATSKIYTRTLSAGNWGGWQLYSNPNIYAAIESKTPENTGFTTLLEYVMHLHSTGIQYAVFSAFNFSDLPQNNWGFNVEVVMSGGAISVKAYKHLSDCLYYFRAITAAGEWASDWRKFVFEQNLQ